MQLDSYVEQVQDQLAAAAALGDDRAREVAAALANAAAPAVRLAVLNALAAVGDEVTAALLDSPGSPVVTIALDVDEIRIAVTTGLYEAPQRPRPDDGDASARISLRLSEALKAEVDDAAAGAGVSVNTWLVRAATTALASGASSSQGGGGRVQRAGSTQHITGWIAG
jgi:hypothetical protein